MNKGMEQLEKHVDTLVEVIAMFELKYGSSLTLQILESVAREIELTIELGDDDEFKN